MSADLHALGGVYVLEDCGGRQYVGSTVNFVARKKQHFAELQAGTHHCQSLQRAYRALEGNIMFRVLESINNDRDLIAREQFWMDKLQPYFNSARLAGRPGGKSSRAAGGMAPSLTSKKSIAKRAEARAREIEPLRERFSRIQLSFLECALDSSGRVPIDYRENLLQFAYLHNLLREISDWLEVNPQCFKEFFSQRWVDSMEVYALEFARRRQTLRKPMECKAPEARKPSNDGSLRASVVSVFVRLRENGVRNSVRVRQIQRTVGRYCMRRTSARRYDRERGEGRWRLSSDAAFVDRIWRSGKVAVQSISHQVAARGESSSAVASQRDSSQLGDRKKHVLDVDVLKVVVRSIRSGMNQGQAARAAGISRETLCRAIARGRREPESRYGAFTKAVDAALDNWRRDRIAKWTDLQTVRGVLTP